MPLAPPFCMNSRASVALSDAASTCEQKMTMPCSVSLARAVVSAMRRLVAAVRGEFPEGVATIEIAIEALKLAEYLTPLLQRELE